MNQILVTQKLYVTPELRRKKKIYKFQFFLSVFLVCLLFSYYIYAEYDREKSEEVSQEILVGLRSGNGRVVQTKPNNDTTIKKNDDVIIVAIDGTEEVPMQIVQETQEATTQEPVNQEPITQEEETTQVQEYVARSGDTYTVESYLRIPELDIDYPIIAETSEELLKISLNKYWGCAPNEVGNYCVVGHNYKNRKMFGRLSEITNGDIVELEDMSGRTIEYEVYDMYTVDPEDTSCTSQLTNGKKELTLITCKEYGTKRLVVKAREVR